jgi:hypothetical protein
MLRAFMQRPGCVATVVKMGTIRQFSGVSRGVSAAADERMPGWKASS